MLRIIPTLSAEGAKSYYTRGDYYSEKQEIIGMWGGKIAAQLGLAGRVDHKAFEQLCDNIDPVTRAQLNPRANTYRRVGYDMNFHAPKSVSVLHALTSDQDILSVFRQAVAETMREMETEMKTRVRREYRNEDRITGNFLYAEFIHTTARPVGGIPDPHLHAHCFTFNTTYDPIEERFKAGQFGDLKRDAPYYEAVFHAHMSKQLAELGYAIRRNRKSWEIDGVPQSVIDKFSRRTEMIENIAKEKRIVSDRAKDKLGAKTREPKQSSLDQHELKRLWEDRLTVLERLAVGRAKSMAKQSAITTRDAVAYALDHSFERESVVSTKRLAASALRFGYGSVGVEEVKQALNSGAVIARDIDGERLATTQEVLSEERLMIAMARSGRGQYAAFADGEMTIANGNLSEDQRAALDQVLSSRDFVTGVRGAAGAGKTTLMKQVIQAIERRGMNVFAFAPSAEASHGVLRSEGFADATTVASLLRNKELQAKLRNNVMWIDEASLLSTKDMKALFDIAREHHARILLSGDSRQHHAVQRGDAQRVLETYAGVKFAELGMIRRQRGMYREAIQALSRGNVDDGFGLLDRIGAIQEIADGKRYQRLAYDYVQAVASRKTVLVVSPTHEEGDAVTSHIRKHLQDAGRVGTTEREFEELKNLMLTHAQRSSPDHYLPGQVIQFYQHATGFRAGEQVRVLGRDDNTVLVQHRHGESGTLPLHQAERFQVYESQAIKIARGDRIRITQNGWTMDGTHRLLNGAIYEVRGFTLGGHIKLTNGWVIDREYGHIEYGYCVTSHAAQGKTVDQVLIAQRTTPVLSISQEQFYVSASRGRERIMIYTDDKQELREAILRSSHRLAAVELQSRGLEPALHAMHHGQRVSRWAEQEEQARRVHQPRGRLAARLPEEGIEHELSRDLG